MLGHEVAMTYDAMINKASQVVYLNDDYSDIYYDAMGSKFYEEEISSSNTTGKHYAGPIVFSESNYNLTSIYIDLGEGMFWKDGEYYVKFSDYQNSTRVVVKYSNTYNDISDSKDSENSILNAEITASEDSKSIQSSITNAEISLETSQINLEKQQFFFIRNYLFRTCFGLA